MKSCLSLLVLFALSSPLIAEKPNVVLIISDDQGFTDYGFMGHEVIKTPNLDRLASESVLYTRGYVTTALCSPSLATLLTGRYPHQHRMTGNDPVRKSERARWYRAFEKGPRLPAMLSEAGYVSFQSGKYWLGHYSRVGFTEGMTVKGRHGEAGLAIGRKSMKPVFDFIDDATSKRKPFFLWYAPFLPHTPHNPPQRLLDKYAESGENAKYFAMCEWFDETCGQLLDRLEQKGLKENTLVVYICDNGWPRPAKGSPYELGVRTPIMLRWPGHVSPRKDETNLANSIDIVPTILHACQANVGKPFPGINLLDKTAVCERDTIFGENFSHDMVNFDRPADSLRSRTCIQKNWKLIEWQATQPKVRISGREKPDVDIELFDLDADPFEKRNLADRNPEKVAALQKKLDQWWDPTKQENPKRESESKSR